MPYSCKKPVTDLEMLAASQACVFNPLLWQSTVGTSYGPFGATCSAAVTDVFATTLQQDFSIDGPVFAALIPQLAAQDPDGLAEILAVTFAPPAKLTPDEADQRFSRLLLSLQESTIGLGSVAGNINASAEAALRAAWRRQAAKGFNDLITGKRLGSIKLGPYITVESSRIGAGGVLRKGAHLTVRVKGLPMGVVHRIDPMFMPKSAGAVLRVGGRDLQRMNQGAVSVANARINSNFWLRTAGSKYGGAALAIGPSLAIDFYQSYTTQSGGMAMVKDFAVRSATSQSGNLLGLFAGYSAIAALGVVGAPAIVIGLTATILVQTAWGYFDGDEWAGSLAKGWVN